MRAPALRGPFIAAASVCLVITLIPSGSGQAAPDLRRAQAAAERLADDVRDLEIRAAIATDRYNAVNGRLQTTVNRLVLAERALDEARLGVRRSSGVAEDRVRALYIAGGPAALMASVLDSGSINEVIDRVGAVDAIVEGDRAQARTSREVLVDAKAARARIGTLTKQRVRLQKQADAAREQVLVLLSTRQARLDAANATVARLAEEEERRRQAEAAEQARVRLAELDLLRTGSFDSSADGPPATPYAARAIAAARSQIGEPYLWGGTGPDAWDCSGLVQWAYRQAGINLSRTSRQQWFDAPRIALADLRAGDLIFWARDLSDPGSIHHVAMYTGGGRMVEAPRTGLDVREIPVYLDGYIGAVRPGATDADLPRARPDRPSPVRADRAGA
jgi:cell wall-associated NlpC family hydrolase